MHALDTKVVFLVIGHLKDFLHLSIGDTKVPYIIWARANII